MKHSMVSLSILCVDDERDIRDILARCLRVKGHKVDTASDGASALLAVERKLRKDGISYDLVITDLKMPEMDGGRFLEEFRKKNITPEVIVYAGDLTPPEVARVSKHRINAFIEKGDAMLIWACVDALAAPKLLRC